MMLPEIPDNDGSHCWAPDCYKTPGHKTGTGLCWPHYQAVRPYIRTGKINGRVFDLLGMRLNVLQETGGGCLSESGRCELRLCRFHLDDDSYGDGHTGADFPEPCAIKLAAQGPMRLEQIAQLMFRTRERIRQIETKALRRLERAAENGAIDAEPSARPVPARRRRAA